MRLVAGLLLLLGLAAVIAYCRIDPMVPPPVGDAPQVARQAPSSTSTAAPGQPERRLIAASQDESDPVVSAIDEDAPRIDVVVVLASTGEPVADADVEWVHGGSHALRAQSADAGRDRAGGGGPLRRRGRTDEQGVVAIPLGDPTGVVARKGSLFGFLDCYRSAVPPEGFRLQLDEVRALRVRVRDAAGRPAADLDLEISCESEHSRYVPNCSARTDGDGLAVFEHLQELDSRSDRGSERPADERWIVRARIVGNGAPEATFDPLAPPNEPIDLQLPPCGRMRVGIEAGGPVLSATLTLQRVGTSRFPAPSVQGLPDRQDGTALFPFVTVGTEVEATASIGSVTLRQRAMGPQRVSEERRLMLGLDREQPMVRFRLVDERRQPLAATAFRFDMPGSRRRTGTTDADGSYITVGLAPLAGRILGELAVEIPQTGSAPWRAERQLPPLRPGVNHLGDVVVQPHPRLVQGRFVVAGKPCEANYWVAIEQRVAPGASADGDGWEILQGVDVCFPRLGEFAVHAPPGLARCRLRVDDEAVLPQPPIEFVPGTADLLVPVEPGAPLVATLLAPPDLPEGLRVTLSPQAVEGKLDPSRLRPWIGPQKSGRSSIEWKGLPAGIYTMEVGLFGFPDVLRTIADLSVPQGLPADQRLVIDLRSEIEVLTVRTRALGTDLETGTHDGVVFAQPIADAGRAPAWQTWGGAVRLLAPARAVDLLVAMRGFRPERVAGARGTVTVPVSPWPALEIALAEPIELPDGFELIVALAKSSDSRRYRLVDDREDDEERSIDLGAPDLEPEPLVGGGATLLVSDQPQRLVVALVRQADSQRVPLVRARPATVLASPTPVALQLDREELRQAIERLR